MTEDIETIRASDVNSERWGGWHLYRSTYELSHDGYLFHLERCCSSAQALDIIMQVAGKPWATDACIAGLVRALNEILDPQAKLCSSGGDKRITPALVREMVDRRPAI